MKHYFYILIVLVFACKKTEEAQLVTNEETNSVNLTKVQDSFAKIETIRLENNTLSSVLKLNGKVDVPPQNLVSVSVPLGGYLVSTKLLPGTYVKKGQILAVLEDLQYIQMQEDYLQTKSKLNLAEQNLSRQLELNKSQASSNRITQEAQNEVDLLRIALSSGAEKLRLINKNPADISPQNINKSVSIYSKINGYVSKVNANIGKYVTPADVLFELINPSDIHLNLRVYEKDIGKLKIGQKLIATTNNNPEKKYECEIILISKDINPDGSAEVHCHFETYDKSILPGMYMNATVELTSKTGFTLPEECIVTFEGENYVFIKNKENNYDMTKVHLGLTENNAVEILNAESLKDQAIVNKGAYTLLMELKNKEEE